MITEKQCAELWEYIKDIKVAMMVSRDADKLRARPMHIVQDGFEGTLFFYTNRQSDKVHEIEKEHDVCLAFGDPDDDTYVSCSGVARIVRDQGLIDRYWNPFVAAWFPKGRKDENIAMIEVHVNKAEIWDADESKMTQLFEIAKANLTDEKPDMGKNRKFG